MQVPGVPMQVPRDAHLVPGCPFNRLPIQPVAHSRPRDAHSRPRVPLQILGVPIRPERARFSYGGLL
jgi:hypothetical protein